MKSLALLVVLCAALAPLGARADESALLRADLAAGRYDEAIARGKRLGERLSEDEALSYAEALVARGELSSAHEVLAREADKPSSLRAAEALAELYELRGEREEAQRQHERLIRAFNAREISEQDGERMLAVARAARGLGAIRDANRAFAEAARAAPSNLEVERAWAELFLDKEDLAHADESLTKILARAPDDARALERRARIRLEQGADFASVLALLDRALATHPNLTSAHVTKAGIALRDMDLEAADRHLDRALAINPRELEALSVRAAVRFLADDEPGFARALARVFAENPRFSRAYSIIATYADWEHRYAELVALARRALEVDPEDARAHATLGLNLLRLGREQEGRLALEESWKRDRYNARVYNTLNLYDEVIDKEYESFEHPPFRVRMHAQERASLAPYAIPLLDRAYTALKERYGITPEGPLSIELYARDEHFAVRTSGYPRLGVQGVCFGKVVTAQSPLATSTNWGQLLWHELSHVFHIELSKSHVPRWFTEGLAEYETNLARPEWKREEGRLLWEMIEHGELPQLSAMNRAFTHAPNGEALMVAYYASTQAVAFIAETYGFAEVVHMLEAWGRGQSSEQVFRSVLGKSLTTVDEEFRAALTARLAERYRDDYRVELNRYRPLAKFEAAGRAPGASPAVRAALAAALAVEKHHQEADALAAEVLAADPRQPLAWFVRAHLAIIAQQFEPARAALEGLLASGIDGYQPRLYLAKAALKTGALEVASEHALKARALDPERAEAHDLLAQLARRTQNTPLLTESLDALATIDQHRREVLNELLPLLAEQRDFVRLVQRAESGLYLAPYSAELHRLYARGLLATGQRAAAKREARQAARLAVHGAAPKRAAKPRLR